MSFPLTMTSLIAIYGVSHTQRTSTSCMDMNTKLGGKTSLIFWAFLVAIETDSRDDVLIEMLPTCRFCTHILDVFTTPYLPFLQGLGIMRVFLRKLER